MTDINIRLKAEKRAKELTQEWKTNKEQETIFANKRKIVEKEILTLLDLKSDYSGTMTLTNNIKMSCSKKKEWDFNSLVNEDLLGDLNNLFGNEEAPFKIEIKENAKKLAEFAISNPEQYKKIREYLTIKQGSKSFSVKK